MEILSRLDSLVYSMSKVRQPLASPRLSEFSEIFPCVCPYACSSALSREKLKLQKLQDNLVKRSKLVRSTNFQVPEKLKTDGKELRKKMNMLEGRRNSVREAAEEVRRLKNQQKEQQELLQDQRQVLSEYSSQIDSLREEISRLERTSTELEGAVASGCLQITALEKERASQQGMVDNLGNAKIPGLLVSKDLVRDELNRIKEECALKTSEGGMLRKLIEEQVNSIKELERMLTAEKDQVDRKRKVIESKVNHLKLMEEKMHAFPLELAARVEAVSAREAEIASMTMRLQRASAVVKEAEEGNGFIDDFSLQLEALRQEEALLISETSENSKILKTLQEERELISDENRVTQRVLNFQIN